MLSCLIYLHQNGDMQGVEDAMEQDAMEQAYTTLHIASYISVCVVYRGGGCNGVGMI